MIQQCRRIQSTLAALHCGLPSETKPKCSNYVSHSDIAIKVKVNAKGSFSLV